MANRHETIEIPNVATARGGVERMEPSLTSPMRLEMHKSPKFYLPVWRHVQCFQPIVLSAGAEEETRVFPGLPSMSSFVESPQDDPVVISLLLPDPWSTLNDEIVPSIRLVFCRNVFVNVGT